MPLQEALQLYHSIVRRELLSFDGYLVEAVDGLCLTAFPTASSAIRWALASQQQCLHAAWSEELLYHELCEPIAVRGPGGNGVTVNLDAMPIITPDGLASFIPTELAAMLDQSPTQLVDGLTSSTYLSSGNLDKPQDFKLNKPLLCPSDSTTVTSTTTGDLSDAPVCAIGSSHATMVQHPAIAAATAAAAAAVGAGATILAGPQILEADAQQEVACRLLFRGLRLKVGHQHLWECGTVHEAFALLQGFVAQPWWIALLYGFVACTTRVGGSIFAAITMGGARVVDEALNHLYIWPWRLTERVHAMSINTHGFHVLLLSCPAGWH